MDFAARYGPWGLVLGASEGTGRAFARLLAERGIPSILIARREAPLLALAGEIRAESGVECVTATIDLAATDAADRIVAAVGDRAVGLFVNNAGGDPYADYFLNRPLADWQGLVQRNVITLLACAHHFATPMVARGTGGLLLVNSGACYGASTTMGVYSGSKAFMLGLAEGLWAELRPHGVDVLTLVLGRTDTPEFRRVLAEKNMAVPADIATAEDVARTGLERLPHGPIHNMGQADDAPGMSPISAAQRRERVVMIDRATSQLFGRT